MNAIKKFLQGIKWELLFVGLFSIGLGVVMMIMPEKVSSVMCYFIGGLLMFCGLFNLIAILVKQGVKPFSFRIIPAALSFIVGVFFLIGANWIFDIIWVFIGVAIIMNSIFKFQYAYELKFTGFTKWWLNLVYGIVSLGLGILLLREPSEDTKVMIILTGAIIFVDGICDILASTLYLINSRRINKIMKKEEKALKAKQKAEEEANKEEEEDVPFQIVK